VNSRRANLGKCDAVPSIPQEPIIVVVIKIVVVRMMMRRGCGNESGD